MTSSYSTFSPTPDSLGTKGAAVTPGETDLANTVKGPDGLTALIGALQCEERMGPGPYVAT